MDLPGGQLPLIGETLFSSVPPRNYLVSVLDPWRAFWARRTQCPRRALNLNMYVASLEIQRYMDTVIYGTLGTEVPENTVKNDWPRHCSCVCWKHTLVCSLVCVVFLNPHILSLPDWARSGGRSLLKKLQLFERRETTTAIWKCVVAHWRKKHSHQQKINDTVSRRESRRHYCKSNEERTQDARLWNL